MISSLPNGSLIHQVYVKKNHSLMVLLPTKFMPKRIIVSDIFMVDLITIQFIVKEKSYPQFILKEKSHLITTTHFSNSYSSSQISKICKLLTQSATLILTFLHPLPLFSFLSPIDHISKIHAKKNIKTIFMPFRSTKDKSYPMFGPRVY
jgi:hypothetical protein